MRNIILIVFIIALFSFKSYKDFKNHEIKNFIVGELENLELLKEKRNISNLTFKNNLNKKVKFSEFKGNVLLINFWATWCAPCVKEMPSLDRLQLKVKNNFKVIPLSVDRDAIKEVENFYIEKKIKNLGQFFDFKNTLAKELDLFGLPTSFFVDTEGFVFAKFQGDMNWDNNDVVKLIKYLNKEN